MIRMIASVLALVLVSGMAISGEPVALLSRQQTGDAQRVVVHFEVGGDLKVQEGKKVQQVPMSVVAQFQYDERFLSTGPEATRRVLRHYDMAEATIKIDQGGAHPVLPEDRRRMLVELHAGQVIYVSPDGLLGRETLDLVSVPCGSLILEELLPGKEVQVGQSWKHRPETIQALVGLDSIAVCDVASVLVTIAEEGATIQLSGRVEGAADGVATQIELKGNYLFNLQNGRITAMHLAIKEDHEPGSIGPGVSVVAKVRMSLESITAPDGLSDQVIAALPDSIELLLPLDYEHAPSGFRLAHDRAWHVTSEQRERIVLRYLASGELAAQCTLILLPKSPPGESTSLEQFQKDVRFSLGDHFGRFISSQQWQNLAGMQCRCIVAEGTMNDLPIIWHCYMISAEDGQRMAATCTVEPSFLQRLDNADRVLVESLVLVPADKNHPVGALTPIATSIP